jgi:DNA-binding NarL/FixJ family response regulator
LREAYARATQLGARRLLEEVRSLARWHRIELVDEVVDEDESPLAAYALTGREHEVLGCLVDGLTNGEIADRLFISAKTASVHVSNILRKLDVSSRHEAARVGHRAGMSTTALS